MITTSAMTPAHRRTVRSVLVCVILALAGGGPAPRAAYAEVAAAAQVLRQARVAPVMVASVTAARALPQRVTVGRSLSRADVVAAPLYLTNCSLLL